MFSSTSKVNMKTETLIFLSIFVLSAVANKIARQFVGKDAEAGQFPYQVSIRKAYSNIPICGGSILSSRFLLTAAYCVHFHKPKKLVAVVGALCKNETGLLIHFDNIIPHEEFDIFRMVNDVALIRTSEEIIFTDFIQPISLPTINLSEEGNIAVIIAGWGITLTLPEMNTLQYTMVHTISNEECKTHKKLATFVKKANVCTSVDNGNGICHGDQGGPLIEGSLTGKHTLVGVLQGGFLATGCASGVPDLFTRVYPYIHWLKYQMEQQN